MICAWKELLSVLPQRLRASMGREEMEHLNEIRLRLDKPPELILSRTSRTLSGVTTLDDLNFCVNAASKYSPWASAVIAQGYVTASGGHRIGVCGQAVCKDGAVTGFRNLRSLCIRVARDFPGIGEQARDLTGSVLIIGPPGRGKTTLLRDVIRQKSMKGVQISVVDERGELFPADAFDSGPRTDILTGCSKAQGIDMVLRAMGPQLIAVDEITAEEDCDALIHAGWCGVGLLATAHCESSLDLRSRTIYRRLLDSHIFHWLIVIQKDRSWRAERMDP